jgi:arsenate reductase (glutaredoxin)
MKSKTYVVYYKPSCSKCRTLVQELEQSSLNCEWVEYLHNPPSVEQLQFILTKSGLRAFDLVRTSEELYKNKFSGKKRSDSQWLKILHKHPELLQRPIVVNEDRVWIARDEKTIQDLIASGNL